LLEPVSALDLANGVLWHSGRAYGSLIDSQPLVVRDLLERLAEPLAVVEARSDAGEGGRSKEWNGDISEQVRLGLIKVKLPELWSVSRLNDFGKCPFRFWVSHVLNIKKMEEPEAGLDPGQKGELYHKALELFYTYLKEQGLTIISPDEERVNNIYEQSIAEYTPILFEQPFGFESKRKDSSGPLSIQVDGVDIKIRGVIDRIDASDSGKYRVVDYKSGAASISAKEALEGRNMQLPIYALALSRAIRPGAVVTGGSFYSVSSGGRTGTMDLEKDGQNVMSVVEQNIARFVKGARGGNFNVRPSSPSSCNHCDHVQVCRISELKKSGGLMNDLDGDD
jgi:ATP-dependent helicase/nuclease subunit B